MVPYLTILHGEMDIVFLIKLEEQCWDSSSPGVFCQIRASMHMPSVRGQAPGVDPPDQPGGL